MRDEFTEQERSFIDYVKAIAIALVVVGHCAWDA